jgi:hypothetical protein
MAKLVKVTIDEESAEVAIDLIGYHGKGCDKLLAAFATLGTLKTQTAKPEYREQAQTQTLKR